MIVIVSQYDIRGLDTDWRGLFCVTVWKKSVCWSDPQVMDVFVSLSSYLEREKGNDGGKMEKGSKIN